MSIISRLTTWTIGQVLKAADLNGEFNNITNLFNNLDAATTSWTNVKTTTLTPTNVGPFTATGAIAMGANKITGLANGTAATDAAAYGQLHVLQAPVYNTLATEFSTTSSTLQSTGLSGTITPTSTGSKVLILVSGSAGTNNAAATALIMTIKRGSTDLSGGATNGLYQCLGTGSTGWRFALPLAFLDSPASVAALTYTLFIRSSDNTTACLVAVSSNESISMTLLEVA